MIILEILVSIVGYLFLIAMCSVFLILSAIALVVCYPFDKKRWVVHNLSRVMAYIFYFLFGFAWHRKIEGRENLDPKRPYIVVMNHNAMSDIPLLYFLPFDFRWVSKRQVFQIPFFGQFLVLHGDIAIERGNPAAAMKLVMSRGLKWLNRGVSVAIFPEGTRSKTGEIGRFKSGAFRLAQEAGVDILPIVAYGTRDLITPRRLMSLNGRVKLRVLPAVSAERVASTDMKELMEEVHAQMCEAFEEIRK